MILWGSWSFLGTGRSSSVGRPAPGEAAEGGRPAGVVDTESCLLLSMWNGVGLRGNLAKLAAAFTASRPTTSKPAAWNWAVTLA